MNLESFRQRCINRITETYNNFEVFDRINSSNERESLVRIQNDDTITNKDEAFNLARQELQANHDACIRSIIEELRTN